MMVVQLLIVVLALFVGARRGSLALGTISGIALAILVFVFGMQPGNPPTDVIYIIIAAVTCAAVLQGSGGMEWMIQIAERCLRKHPERITFYAPLFTFFLTVLCGTGHVVYTLMPIIADISLKEGIRPERPCAVASIASQLGITCSPIAAAVVAFTAISVENGFDVTIPQVVMVTLPACLIGLFAAIACSYRRGKDLDKDPEFQERLKDPETFEYMYGGNATSLNKELPKGAKGSVFIFIAVIASIVILAASGYKQVKMNLVIQIIMLAAAGLMFLLLGIKPKQVLKGSVFQNGMVAVVTIFGIAWMADTLFANYMTEIQDGLGGIVARYPWAISVVFFLVSILLNSQGAVVVSMVPLAYSLGIPGPVILGALPSVYAYFFIPTYPSDLATINFDRSGTTRIGKFLLNHSFMMPGMVSVVTSTVVGLIITSIIY